MLHWQTNVDQFYSKHLFLFLSNNNTQIVMTAKEPKQNNHYTVMKWFDNNNETDMHNSSVMTANSITSLTKREPPLQLLKIATNKLTNQMVPIAAVAPIAGIAIDAGYEKPRRQPAKEYSASSTTASSQYKIKPKRKIINTPPRKPTTKNTITKQALPTQAKLMKHSKQTRNLVEDSTTSSIPSGQTKIKSKRKSLITVISLKKSSAVTKKPLKTQANFMKRPTTGIKSKQKPSKTVLSPKKPNTTTKKPSPANGKVMTRSTSSTVPSGQTGNQSKQKPPKTPKKPYIVKKKSTPIMTTPKKHSASSTSIPSRKTKINFKQEPSKNMRFPKPPKKVTKKRGLSLAYNRPYVSSSSPSSSASSSSSRTNRPRRKPRITTSTKHKAPIRTKNDKRIVLPHDQRKKLHISEKPMPNYNRPSASSSKSSSSGPAKGFDPKKTWSSSSTEVIKQVITKTLIESHVHRKHLLGSNSSQ